MHIIAMASHLLPKKLYTTHFAKAFCVYDQDSRKVCKEAERKSLKSILQLHESSVQMQ